MKRDGIRTALLLAAMAASVTASHGAPAGTSPEMRCTQWTLPAIEGVDIASTQAVTDREDLPGFCAIRGTIQPDIGFEARLPLRDWNGKYYQSGCGGFCGEVRAEKEGYSNTINNALRRGYAAITTDAGHRGGLGDASWAKDNPVAVEMYAGASIPLTHAAGTALVREFYGLSPKLQYFSGCSNGGRMAAIAAQRYPQLFDGILGGSGVLNLSENGGIYGPWVVRSNTRADGSRIIDRENFAYKLPTLEAAVLAQCDASDGQADGRISAPRNCTVDPAALPHCEDGGDRECFTRDELAVLEKWYQGPQDSAGRKLYPGMPPGSERYWVFWFLDGPDHVAPGNSLGSDYAKYLGFDKPVPDTWSALYFDFDKDPQRLETKGQQLDALDADLSAFRDVGGKFLMWHGWEDPLVLPDQSVAYYENVVSSMADDPPVASFLRLFMIPGQGHCWELPSAQPDDFNPIAALENWVEKGEAPTELKVISRTPDQGEAEVMVVCPYPSTPIYLSYAGEKDTRMCPAAP